MLDGKELGDAIRTAIELKKVDQKDVAKAFGVKPPSVTGWLKTGRISKKHLDKLIAYFSDVVPPEHFGLKVQPEHHQNDDTITFQHREIYTSCGSGVVNTDFPEVVRTLEIPKERITELFGTINPEGLDIVGIKGDSMEPTLPQKGLAFIDTRIQEFNGDGIYAFYYVDGSYMKRLQKVPGKLIAHSDNSHYQDFEILPENEGQFIIFGKFVGVLPLKIHEL